jgi:flagellar protein FliO/FliZ
MFDTLFGAEMPLAVRFFLAFLIVLALIGATAWAVRRFGTGRLGTNTRGRQPRLAVIDYASVDGRRRLILVRRDNVEHLLMIGGPTDVVVEPNIVRGTAAPRDTTGSRPAVGIESLPRAIPLPENGNGSAWPLQPESTPSLRSSPRVESLPDEPSPRLPQPAAETPPRPQRDTLSALADELSTRPAPPRNRTPAGEPRLDTPLPEPRKPAAPPPVIPAAAPAAPAVEQTAAEDSADQSLADMAQRLEAALRKPNAEPAAPPAPRPQRPAPERHMPERAAPAEGAMPRMPRPSQPRVEARPEARPEPRIEARPETRPARAEAKPNQSKTALYDSLEQEMASLLGRPNKP